MVAARARRCPLDKVASVAQITFIHASLVRGDRLR